MNKELITLNWEEDFPAIVNHIKNSGTPLIISNFFEPVDKIPMTAATFSETFQKISLEFSDHRHEDFVDKIRKQEEWRLIKKIMSLKDYEEVIKDNTDLRSRLKCQENFIPSELAASLQSKMAKKKMELLSDVHHKSDFHFKFFLGIKGQVTPPHFDWSNNNSILFQIYGKKVVYLFAPNTYNKLPFISNHLEINLQELLKLATSEKIPYQRIELEDGKGLYIPPYHLHSVEYPSDACSISLRFLPIKPIAVLHRLLPPNKGIALLLSIWNQSKHWNEGKILNLIKPRPYREQVELYRDFLKVYLAESQLPLDSEYSLVYEGKLHQFQQSFDHQIALKLMKQEILKRGASYIS